MKQYWISKDGQEQVGPFTKEELKSKQITAQTLVWFEGLEKWQSAKDLPELSDILQTTEVPIIKSEPIVEVTVQKSAPETTTTIIQPQVKEPTKTTNVPTQNKKEHSKSDKATRTLAIIAGIVILLFFAVKIMTQNNGSGDGTYEEQVLTVEQTEQKYPVRFLNASGTYHESFWGDKLKINGTVTNSATIATYKDVVIEVRYYSKTESVIATENYVIYDYFPPQQTKNFELKITNYKGTSALGWSAIDAKPSY